MASREEINRAARAVAAMVTVKPDPLRATIGELVSPGALKVSKKNLYPGARQQIHELLSAHPNGMYVSDITGQVKMNHPTVTKQNVYNMLSAMQMQGNVKNLGKGTGMWGVGPVPFGQVRRRRRPKAALSAKANGAWKEGAVVSQADMEMAVQNLRVALADMDKVIAYVMERAADTEAKAEKLAKAVAALA